MKRKNKKPSALEIANVIINAVIAIAEQHSSKDRLLEGRKPPEGGGGNIYYSIKLGGFQVANKNNYWIISLVALWIIGYNTDWRLSARILLAANAIVVLVNCAAWTWRTIKNGRKA